jgi:cyclic dehypoxanthinyl futalosine synthase
VRQLQDETGGFAAFSARNASAGREWEEATAVEYLKVLAVSRVLLENIENVEADWMPQGLKVLQMALRFGCNDAGSVSTRNARGNASATTEEDLRRVIRGAGFEPVQRDALYRSMLIA